jgi:hypothetical protein
MGKEYSRKERGDKRRGMATGQTDKRKEKKMQDK